jgi:predicted CXXCH cytochrome family protein
MRCAQKAILSVLLLVLVRGARAQTVEPHTLRAGADCTSCHGDKTSGRVVHSAMAMGCAVCHQVVADGKTTAVRLTMPKGEICFACHGKSGDENQHPPYAQGQCVSCHDPHSSNFPMHLRAEVTTLCLGCHTPQGLAGDTVQKTSNQQPRPESDSHGSKLDPVLQAIHHSSGRFLALMSVLQNGPQPVTCISCHQPHSSQDSKLLRK